MMETNGPVSRPRAAPSHSASAIPCPRPDTGFRRGVRHDSPKWPAWQQADLRKYWDVLITPRDSVEKLESAGKPALEAVAKNYSRSRPREQNRLSDALSL